MAIYKICSREVREANERREDRRKVALRARMRAAGMPLDVSIRDISARGAMVESEAPPGRGTFVEIIHRGLFIVGQVRWREGRRFGIELRDRLDVDSFLRGEAGTAGNGSVSVDRRTEPRKGLPAAERARIQGARLQFLFVSTAAVALSLAIGYGVHAELAGLSAEITAALDGRQGAVER